MRLCMEGGKKINRGRGLELEVLGQNVSTTADLWRAKPSEPWCGGDVMARVGPIPALSFEDAKGVAATRSFGPGASASWHAPRWAKWCESGGESMSA